MSRPPRVIICSDATMVAVLVLLVILGPPQAEAARAFFVRVWRLDHLWTMATTTTWPPLRVPIRSPPYGIDFPTHRPTGRFSNGLNLPDLISEQMGSELLLPYLSSELTGQKLLNGANFASAGIGILNDTGVQFINIIRNFRQFELYMFQQYQQRVSALIGAAQAKRLVNNALVLITLGGNDFVNNYFLVPFSARSRQFSVPQYSQYLISEYRKILLRLYELGGRRELVTGIGPLGCVPSAIAQRSRNGECAPELQEASAIFNPLLVEMAWFRDSTYAQLDNGVGLCTLLSNDSNLCSNRGVYAFWDPFQPSKRANRLIVQTMMTGSSKHMNPMNLSTIMAMDSNN